MHFRFIEWNKDIYVVLGIGYDQRMDPPDVFICVPLENQSIYRTVLTHPGLIKIPIAEAIEITEEKRIRAIWTLYGG
jgi:hypothetical protein